MRLGRSNGEISNYASPDGASGQRGSIRIALYFSLFGLLLAMVAAAGVLYARAMAERYARADASDDASFAAKSAAEQIDDSLIALREQMMSTGSSPAVEGAINQPEGCTLTFTGLGPISSGHLDFLGPDGSLKCTSMPRPDGDYIDADWLMGVQGYTLVGPMVDNATGKSVLVSVTPVGENAGFAVVFLDLDSLGLGLSAQFGGRRNLEMIVMTADSQHIVTRSVAAAQWTGANPVATPFADITGAGTHADVDGVERIYGHAVVQAQGWHLFAGADEDAALAGSKDSFLQALSVMLVALGAMLLILVVVYRRIAGPIRAAQPLGSSTVS